MTDEVYKRFRLDSTKIGMKSNGLTSCGASFALPSGKRWGRVRHVVVECKCGNRSVVMWNCFRRGAVKSCGCAKAKQGGLRVKFSNEYKIWTHMLDRCENPECNVYQWYGGRGITVCERWHDFRAFIEDVGPRPSPELTLDRIENNGNYEPGNVRWATREVNVNNRRNTTFLEIDGVVRPVGDWSRESGTNRTLIHARLKRGWEPRHAVFGK